MKYPRLNLFVTVFACCWLIYVSVLSIRQSMQINDMQRYIGRKATEANAAYNTNQATNLAPLPAKPRLSNADLAKAANMETLRVKEITTTQLFVKEQQQSLQRQVEAFLTTTEPLLLSTNLDRASLSQAITAADELHSKIDPNNFNPILEIRFDARRGTLQSLVKQ